MKAIMACDLKGGYAVNGGLPWPKESKDLQRFKELTSGQRILMGRGTWEGKGMPKPLPNRVNIIASTSDGPYDYPDGVAVIKYLSPENLALANVDWVIGGAKLIEAIWDQIDEFHLTRFRREYIHDQNMEHLLQRLETDFTQTRCQICLTHQYQIWKRKEI